VLAYKNTNLQLRIRWSDDGVNWTPATSGNPSISYGPGLDK